MFDIPAHRLHPAEADLRLVVNTIRNHQAGCRWCRRCDGRDVA